MTRSARDNPETPRPMKASPRRAGADDARAIAALESRVFPASEDPFSVDRLRRMLRNPRAVAMVVDDAGVVVGWSVALVRRNASWLSGRIYSVAVDPGHAGRGIGRALVESLLAELEPLGVQRIYLEVRADNEPAIKLYRSLGFAPVGWLDDYYGPGRDGMRMLRESRSVNPPVA